MKIKVKVKPWTEADKLATQEKIRNTVNRAIEAANANQPITRTKQPNGTAGVQLNVYVPEGMAAHITQLAQVERRTISSICQELLGVALGLVETPEEAAASEAIVQRAQNPRDDGDIAALTLDGIKRATNGLVEIDLPNPRGHQSAAV